MSKRRVEKLIVDNRSNILKQENCYIIRLDVNILQICASMYNWFIKISHLISKTRVAN
jgi:hypothetical protein